MSDNGKFSFPQEHGHSDEDAEKYQKIAEKAHENLTSTGEHETEFDHEKVLNNHKKIYESDDVTEHSGEELGHAAAFEALKKVCSGEKYDKSELLSLAMSEAMKLWKKRQGGGGGGDGGGGQEEVLSGAASMAMKLMNKSGGAGGDGGGLSSMAMNYFK